MVDKWIVVLYLHVSKCNYLILDFPFLLQLILQGKAEMKYKYVVRNQKTLPSSPQNSIIQQNEKKINK